MKNLAKAALVGCLLTTSLFLAGAADAQTPARLTARQVRELGYWGGRYPDLAKLANPPIGSVRPELRKLEKLVREIVATMYPTAFKDFQLTVSIYPTQKPAIFVVQPEWPLTGEEPRSPFLHKLLGFDAKKPMYELGIGLGLVNKLETVDQLAFVIGREVARLYDGQVEERPDREKLSAWWGAQAHESVSDFKSVEKMLGKYDLEAAVQALVRLSEQFTEKPHDVIAMLIAGFDGKQHEGVRISQTQAHVGYLRRVSADAQPRRQVPLPPEAHIYKNPREVAMPMHTPETLAQAERYVQQFITRVLLKNEPYGALDLGFFGSSNEDSPYKKFNMKYPPFRRPKLEDLQRIMYQGVDRIMSSRVSVQTKGNALLQFMISMGQAQTFLRPEFNKKSKLFLERHANQALARPFVVAILRLKEQGWDPKLTTDLYFKGQSEVSIMKASRPNSMVSDMNSGVLVGSAFLAALSRFETGRTIIGELVRSDLTRFPGETVERTSNFLQHMMNVGPIQRVEEDEKKFLEVAAESNKIIARSIIPLITPEILREALGLNTGTPTPEQRQHWSEFLRIHERAVEYNYPAYFIATVKETVDEIHKFAAGEKARIFAQLRAGRLEALQNLNYYLVAKDHFPITEAEKKELGKLIPVVGEALFSSDSPRDILGLTRSLKPYVVEAEIARPVSKQAQMQQLAVIALMFSQGSSAMDEADKPKWKAALAALSHGLTAAEFRQLYDLEIPAAAQRLNEFNSNPEFIELKKATIAEIAAVRKKLGPKAEDKEIRTHILFNDMELAHDLFRKQLELHDITKMPIRFQTGLLSIMSVLPQRDELLKGFDLLFIRHAIARMVAEERKGRNLQNRLVNELSPVLEGKVIEVGLDNRDHEVGIVEMFWSMQARAKSLEEWVSALQAVVRHARTGLEMRPEIKIAIEDRFMALTKDRNPTDVFRILKNSGILPVLSEKSVVPALLNEVRGHLGDRPEAAQLQAQIKRVEEALTLREKYPDIYDAFRTDAAEQFKLQPKDVNLVLPKDGTDVVNHRNAENFSAEIRGLSALVGLSRNKSPAEQMELIEYLMGRSTKLPQYIYDAQAKAKQPVVDAARGLQMRLARQDVFERGFITNSFLAGPGSMLETREGLDYVLNYVLRNLDEKDFGMRLARALLRSQGDMKSLFIAYVLSQKPGENGGELTSGQIVRSVFEAFGAAGIKLGQYLAFSNELGKYTADLAALQDSAMPLSYLAIIRLIDKRFGGKWYNEWFIADVLGSGSVNVAVRLEHRVTKEIRVLSILRDEIEIASRDDFRNLNVFVAEFIRSEAEAERRRLQFLPGLLKFVQRSLNLEFDKLNAYLMQKMANGSYIHDFESGWKVRSVRAEGHGFGGLFTSLATGKSARKIKTRDFKLYKEAMLHLMEVEIDFLFGVDASGKPKPVPFIANADLHDGQVIIDAEKKILFILDFGQAVTITNEQRELAIELLKAVQAGRFNGIKSALNNLQANFGVKGQAITDNEIGEILKRTDFMDRFIFMLGLLEGKSWDLPLSSIHWVFSLNRLIQLGEQVGVRIKPAIGALLYSRKLGTSLERFNQLRLLVRSARETIGYPSLPIRTPLKPTENRAAGLSCRSAVAQ